MSTRDETPAEFVVGKSDETSRPVVADRRQGDCEKNDESLVPVQASWPPRRKHSYPIWPPITKW